MSYAVENYPYLDSVALFAQVADQPWAVFLDSGAVGGQRPVSKHADFDVLAINPNMTLVTEGQNTTVTEHGDGYASTGDPLALLQSVLPKRALSSEQEACPYLPGAIGYFSYDLSRRFEVLPQFAENDEQLPEMAIGIYHAIVVVDHKHKDTKLIYWQHEDLNAELLTQWRTIIRQLETLQETEAKPKPEQRCIAQQPISDNMSRTAYQRCFQSVRDYTIAGDCYQVNLAKRFSAAVAGDAWQTYVALRNASPAPYGAYFNLPFAQVLSNSPESFIRCRKRQVVTSPIKGTSARDHSDSVNDKRVGRALLNSAKDRAENLMIVDLMRNDLSRCCELGSVKVPKLFALHSFANVHHLISTITGKLKPDLHALDLLRSCFPGGSITGTPKIRAMQIIEELEPHRRGLYCGAIGYVGMDGSLETNIAIRTIIIKDGVARFSAGGGLVIDSDEDEEYQEIIDKASMMTEALKNH